MPRSLDPAVRTTVVERAAAMLAARQPVTSRALVEGSGVSTMAVYTYFGGMAGVWRAVRQEGFTRLGRQLAAVDRTTDPVRDLAALGAAYLRVATDAPDLYRAMFDAAAELEDPEAAGAGMRELVGCAVRAREAGRFTADPEEVAVRLWAAGHGLAALVATGVLPAAAVGVHGAELAVGTFLAAGDDPVRCRASVAAGWG